MDSENLWTLARDLGTQQISTAPPQLQNLINLVKIDNIIQNGSNFTSIARVTTRLSPYPEWLVIILWLLTAVFSIETILGNLLVLMAYKLERSIRRQLSNKFIVSLAVTDLIIGMEGFPLLTVYVVGRERWPLGQTLCQIWLCLDYTLCLVSILTVLLITVDRYGSVCYPTKYRTWQTNTRVRVFVVFSWVLPCLFFGVMIFGWDYLTGHRMDNSGKCYAPFLNDPYVNMSMYIVYYWTTLVAVSVLYRGIHTAAKTLEDKSKARERQTIALLLGQRCMAQVGVGMLFHSSVHEECAPHEMSHFPLVGSAAAGAGHDSGYMTTTATVTTHTNTSAGTNEPHTGARGSLAGKSEFEIPNLPIIITQSPPTSVSLSSDRKISPMPEGTENIAEFEFDHESIDQAPFDSSSIDRVFDDRSETNQSINGHTDAPLIEHSTLKNHRRASKDKLQAKSDISTLTPLMEHDSPVAERAPIAATISDSSSSTFCDSPIKALYTAQAISRQHASVLQQQSSVNRLQRLGTYPKRITQQTAKNNFDEPSLLSVRGPRSRSLIEHRRQSSQYRAKSLKKNRISHQNSGCSLEFYGDNSTSVNNLYGDVSLSSVLEFDALIFESAANETDSTPSIFGKNHAFTKTKSSCTTNLGELFRSNKINNSEGSDFSDMIKNNQFQENGDKAWTNSTSSSNSWTRSASSSIRSQHSAKFDLDNLSGGNSNSSSPLKLNAARSHSLDNGKIGPGSNGTSGKRWTSLKNRNGGNLKLNIAREDILEEMDGHAARDDENSVVWEEKIECDISKQKSHKLKESAQKTFSKPQQTDVVRKIDDKLPGKLLQIIIESEPIQSQPLGQGQGLIKETYLPPIIEEEKSTTTKTEVDPVSRRSSGVPSSISSLPGAKTSAKEKRPVTPVDSDKLVRLAVPTPMPPGFANVGSSGSRKGSASSSIASTRRRRGTDRDWGRSSWQSITSSIYQVGRRQTRRWVRAVDDDDDSDGREPGSSADDSNSDRKRSTSWFATLFNNPTSILHRKRKVTKAEKRARKAFRTITVIVGTFALFWSPYYIVATIYGFCQDCVPAPLFLTSYYLCYLNSSVNPFAYAFANRLFRKTFIRILKGDLRRT